MLLNLEKEKITLRCSHCSNVFEETVSRVIYEPKVCCPSCRHAVKIDLLELQTMFEAVRKHARRLLIRLVGRRGGSRLT